MTHLESIIRDVKRFVPITTSQKKLKKRVLVKLYGIENAEPKRKTYPRRKRVIQSKSSPTASILAELGSITHKGASSLNKAIQNKQAERKALKAKIAEIKQKKELAGYAYISDKQTKKQAQEELKHNKPFIVPQEPVKPNQVIQNTKGKIIHRKYDDSGNEIEVSTLDE